MKNSKQTIVLFLLLFSTGLWAQEISGSSPIIGGKAKISLLTCGAGPELYEAFGHSAIRISDPLQGLDLVFNYGVFDFNQENFYGNFAKGSMRYMLGVNSFEDFMFQYHHYKRSVNEQVLNLDSMQKQAVVDYLNRNLRPENREYFYDYFYRNCSTKIIDLLDSALNGAVVWEQAKPEGKVSFRQLIHQYTVFQPWGRLGIDLGLGSLIDLPMQGKDIQFLPDGVYNELSRAKIRRGLLDFPLVIESSNIYQSEIFFGSDSFFLSPAFFFSILLLVSVFLFFKGPKFPLLNKIWAGFLFFFVGILGLVELCIWLFTNHKAAAWNYNLMWANPLFMLIGLYFLIAKSFPKPIRNALLYYISAVLIFWFLIPQTLNVNLLPLVAALLFCVLPEKKLLTQSHNSIVN